jgi:hypothetical protein
VSNRPSLKGTLRTVAGYLYTQWWESKRYGLFSRLHVIAEWVGRTAVPLAVAAYAATDVVDAKWLVVSLSALVGVLYLLSLLQQRSKRRPMVKDVYGLRQLQRHLRVYKDLVGEIATKAVLETKFRHFMIDCIHTTCEALCGDRHLRGSIMFWHGEERYLSIAIVWPESRDVDEALQIPLRDDGDGEMVPVDGKGLAGYAIAKKGSAYMPNRAFGATWFLDVHTDGCIDAVSRGDCWKGSKSRRLVSVLSVPLIYRKRDEEKRIGVLNIESGVRDCFGDADFHLAALVAEVLVDGCIITAERNEQMKQ